MEIYSHLRWSSFLSLRGRRHHRKWGNVLVTSPSESQPPVSQRVFRPRSSFDLQWSHVRAARRRPWRRLLLLTRSLTWTALTHSRWNSTTVSPHTHIFWYASGLCWETLFLDTMFSFIKSVYVPPSRPHSPGFPPVTERCHHRSRYPGNRVRRGRCGSRRPVAVALVAQREACGAAAV